MDRILFLGGLLFVQIIEKFCSRETEAYYLRVVLVYGLTCKTVVCETLRIYVQFLGMATQTTHRENPGRICKKHPKNLSVWLRDFLSKEAMYSYVVVQPRS